MGHELSIFFLGGRYPYRVGNNIIAYGGGEITEYKLAAALKEAGAAVRVISMDASPLPRDAAEIDAEIGVVRTSRRFTGRILRGIEGRCRGIPAVLEECGRDKPDIMLAYSINRGIEASFAEIVHNVPFIVANSWGYPRLSMSSMDDTLLYAVSLAWKNAAAVVFPSKIYADEVRSNIPWMKEVRVIPNGVDPDFFRLGNAGAGHNGAVRFISTSRVVNGKGIEFLVEASKGLSGKKVAHALDIVGEGPLEERIRQQAMKIP